MKPPTAKFVTKICHPNIHFKVTPPPPSPDLFAVCKESKFLTATLVL